MKTRILFHSTAVVVLVAAVVAAAQTPSTPTKSADTAPKSQSGSREASVPSVSEREAQSGMATGKRQHSPISLSAGRESSAPSVSEREAQSGMASGRKSGSVIVLDREASSGMATGKRQHEPPILASASEKSLGSAHAVESVTAPQPATGTKGNMQGATSNPLYENKGNTGNNPLYEPKDKQAAAAMEHSHETVEYKDPEDMTTRYRPGNNKTTNVKPASSTTTPPSH